MSADVAEIPAGIPVGFEKLNISSGFVSLIGPFFRRIEGEEYTYGILTEARHGNVNRVMHGGVLFAFADTICGQYILAQLGRRCATVSMNSNFVAPGRPGQWIEGRLRVTKATRSLCYMTVDLSADGNLLYSANAIFKLFDAVEDRKAAEAV